MVAQQWQADNSTSILFILELSLGNYHLNDQFIDVFSFPFFLSE